VVTFARAEETRVPAPPAEIPAHGQGRMGLARGGVNGAPRPAEPIIEGFFIARVAGEGEARRHHLVEGTARRSEPKGRMEDGLGELPTGYEDDALRALARDPSTLFVSWDFHPRTLERAGADLKLPRAVLRLYEGEVLAREAEVAIESRSFYVHGLRPGRRYRVEAHWVGVDGISKMIGRSQGEVELPAADDVLRPGEARFAELHWDQPLASLGARLGAARTLSQQEAEEFARRIPRSWAYSASDRSQWTPAPERLMPKEQAEELARRIPRARGEGASDQSRWMPPPSGQP